MVGAFFVGAGCGCTTNGQKKWANVVQNGICTTLGSQK